MDKKIILALVVMAVILIIGAIFYFSASPQKETFYDSDMLPVENNGESNIAATPEYSGTIIAGKDSPLIDFDKSDYDTATQTDKLVVLYFYANWCPICRVEVANALYPAFSEITTGDVIGFRVNYNDNQTDSDEKNLAREFGIAYQHTKVFLKKGQRVLKSPEGWDKNRYLEEINRYK